MGECHGDDGAKGLEFVYVFGIVYETSRANYDYMYVHMELSVLATRLCGAFRIGGADTADGEGRRETIVSCN